MRLLEQHNCADYLRETKLIGSTEEVSVQFLAGGVSNVVLLVKRGPEFDDFVLKQARGQLRVEQPWFCSVERIWREVETLRICRNTLHDWTNASAQDRSDSASQLNVVVPEVLFEDRDNYVFTMTAAPPGHATWKEQLLAGQFDEQIAYACGELLGRLHAGTWNDQTIAKQMGDRQYFIDLRVDPYYRSVATVHADLAPAMNELILSLDENRCCLVHGDFSPKNLLVWKQPSPTVMLIDCEVGHYGDPAFDLGFMLSHLTLKAVFWRSKLPGLPKESLGLIWTFCSAYADAVRGTLSPQELHLLQRRLTRNLAACLLARVDGKSPVEYLERPQQELVRQVSRGLFSQTFEGLQQVIDWISDELE